MNQVISSSAFVNETSSSCRLDLWLYRTRLLKTRSLATRKIRDRKIRVFRNGQTEKVRKPHTLIKPGDRITFMRGSELISVQMLAPGTRRGPASEAQALYKWLSEAQIS